MVFGKVSFQMVGESKGSGCNGREWKMVTTSVFIKLFEYGNIEVKNYSSTKTQYYNISMKCTDGSVIDLPGYLYPNEDRISIASTYRDSVINALKKEGIVTFYIEEEDHSVNNYLFKVECDNFKELYKKRLIY